MNKELQIVEVEAVKVLPQTEQASLQEAFNGLFEQANQWTEKAKSIKVTDINDVEGMSAARETRLQLKNIRVEAEKVRKQLKEDSLRKGKAIDGIYNLLEYLIKPLEEELMESEKFAEIQEEKRLSDLENTRKEELGKYVADVSPYNLRTMSDEAYAGILADAKKNRAERIEREAAEEKARQAKLEEQRKEQERIRQENEKLRAENEKKEKELAKQKAEAEAKLKKEREEAEAKLKAEREAKEKLEREAAEKKAEEDRIAAEKAEEARQAALAPDKEKVKAFANKLWNMEYPSVASDECQALITATKEAIEVIAHQLNQKANDL